MERSLQVIVVGCLQRLGSAAACVQCHSLMSLDDGGAARRGGRFSAVLLVSACATRFHSVLDAREDAYKNRAGHQSMLSKTRWAITRSTGRLNTS